MVNCPGLIPGTRPIASLCVSSTIIVAETRGRSLAKPPRIQTCPAAGMEKRKIILKSKISCTGTTAREATRLSRRTLGGCRAQSSPATSTTQLHVLGPDTVTSSPHSPRCLPICYFQCQTFYLLNPGKEQKLDKIPTWDKEAKLFVPIGELPKNLPKQEWLRIMLRCR